MTGGGQYEIANYGFFEGDWFVWGGLGSTVKSRGTFGVNQSRTFAEFTDGLSNTLFHVRGARAISPTFEIAHRLRRPT